uniref:C2 tensin-type domain-containing protein n=1 Tax=Syphacia muris TaxID=451379 RepID=A0A0N5ACP4_9BILA
MRRVCDSDQDLCQLCMYCFLTYLPFFVTSNLLPRTGEYFLAVPPPFVSQSTSGLMHIRIHRFAFKNVLHVQCRQQNLTCALEVVHGSLRLYTAGGAKQIKKVKAADQTTVLFLR